MRRAIAIIALLGAALIVPSPIATAADCRVTNVRAGEIATTLQDAVDASTPGDRLRIEGTCVGTTRIEATRLVLEGVATTDQAALDGDDAARVLVLRRATVVLKDLTVANGRAPSGAGIDQRGGRLRLKGTSSVTGNETQRGAAGILVWDGVVTLEDSSSVTGNIAGWSSAGIGAFDSRITMNDDASVSDNVAEGKNDGGIGVYSSVLTMNDRSSVTGNSAFHRAGGIGNNGRVVLNEEASVTGNSAGTNGGGVGNVRAVLVLNGTSTVSGNTATWRGGGIGINASSRVVLNEEASVTDNTAGAQGGGVYGNWGSLTLNGSASITGNTAGTTGGGVFVMEAATVYVCSDEAALRPNDPNDPPETEACP